jgi:hypothetical protein
MPLSWGEKHGNQFQKKIALFPTDSTSFCPHYNKCKESYMLCKEMQLLVYFEMFASSENTLTCKSLESAMQLLQTPPYLDQIENIWIIGGASVYKVVFTFLI